MTLPPLPDAAQALWALDATINQRGFYTDGPLLEAAAALADNAKVSMHEEIARITDGAVENTDKLAKLQAWLAGRGCAVKDGQKGTLKAALRRKDLDPVARRAIELRLASAHAVKVDTMLAWRCSDGRIRGTLQFHGAGTGRWAARGVQVQNFVRDDGTVDAKIAAIMAGDLSRYPEPLGAIADAARGAICAAPGHRFLIGDLSGIESRVLAWVAGQADKVAQWRKFDETGDPRVEPYFILGKACGFSDERARQGKFVDLAFGYMGGVAAYAGTTYEGDPSTEAEREQFKQTWRRLHPHIVAFWYATDRAAIKAVRTPGSVHTVKCVSFQCVGDFLETTLPSGRIVRYPFPRIETNRFDEPCVMFKDTARGQWGDCNYGRGAYGGLWTENIVQAIACDLLAEAMLRLEAAGYPIVLTVHDEIVCEVPDGFGSLEEFKRLFVTPPDWAAGMPIAAKVREGLRFNKPAAAVVNGEIAVETVNVETAVETVEIADKAPDLVEPDVPPPGAAEVFDDAIAAAADPDRSETAPPPPTWGQIRAAFERTSTKSPGLGNGRANGNGHAPHAGKGNGSTRAWPSLADLIGQPLFSGKISCPFHDDPTPSCHIYPDHFHCYGCGAHGGPLEWLMTVEGATHDAALYTLETWSGPRACAAAEEKEGDAKTKRMLELAGQLWGAAQPIAGTLAERYLVETRKLDLMLLPDIDAVLRFHPKCPFNGSNRKPCLIALFRDVATDAPAGIHRIALTADAQKIDRMMLGSWPAPRAIKLWPAGPTLAIGEGIETTLAAATRCSFRGAPLQPAWAMASQGNLELLPPFAPVEQLIVLADNDAHGQGQAAARNCALTWQLAGRQAVLLTPQLPDSDFNDVVRAWQCS